LIDRDMFLNATITHTGIAKNSNCWPKTNREWLAGGCQSLLIWYHKSK